MSCGAVSKALGLQQPQLVGSGAQAQWLWGTGLAALRHVGSSRTVSSASADPSLSTPYYRGSSHFNFFFFFNFNHSKVYDSVTFLSQGS